MEDDDDKSNKMKKKKTPRKVLAIQKYKRRRLVSKWKTFSIDNRL